jgi:hypothetical protein
MRCESESVHPDRTSGTSPSLSCLLRIRMRQLRTEELERPASQRPIRNKGMAAWS